MGQIGSDLPSLRVLAGRNGRAGWRANGRIDVELLEPYAFRSKGINVGGLGFCVTEAGKIAPTHVIHKNKNDIRSLIRCQSMGLEYEADAASHH